MRRWFQVRLWMSLRLRLRLSSCFTFGTRALVGSVLCYSLLFEAASAQQPSPYGPVPELQKGLHYFVIKDLQRGQVVLRGRAGSNGLAFESLLLAPDTFYRLGILQASSLKVGFAEFTTPSSGQRFEIPRVFLMPDTSPDLDRDGLHDLGETIIGTNPKNPDTDGDGIKDGAEVQQGTNPLDGKPVQTGIISTIDTPGNAVDICALNDLIIVADSAAGIAVFNVFNGMNPTLVAQVDTPGNARAVSCSGNLIAVADDTAGLAIIDITDPPASRIRQQIQLGGSASAVAVAGNTAFVGLTSGTLVSVDLLAGDVLDRITLSGSVQDIAINGDTLYVLTESTLYALGLDVGFLKVSSSIAAPGITPNPRKRLFAGGDVAYAVHGRGYNVFNLANPLAPTLRADISTTQLGWKQIVSNGSGLGLAADGPNRSDDGPHNVSLYAPGPVGTANQFLATFETPGIATAVSIYNGLAYVADGTAGMQVINYLAYDNKGVPPTISLSASFPVNPAQIEEGKAARVTASVADDVQVRNVEFYIDGIKIATDGNFPFEHRFVTSSRSAAKTSLKLRAKATDTGGNSTWTDELTVNLTPDATPPRVRRVSPALSSISGSVKTMTVYFSEPINPSTSSSATLQVRSAGRDGIPGNADDVLISNGVVSYRDTLNAMIMEFPIILPAGLYQGTVRAPLADLAGNQFASLFRWTFHVISGVDSDHDGVPDSVELQLGLNPFSSESQGDGILDGDRDFDRDGLSNAGEILVGTDPRNPHTIDPKILDGDLDRDQDSLTDGQESRLGTNPLTADSDGDGWNDESEVTTGSNPLSADSTPDLPEIAWPLVAVEALGEVTIAGFEFGVTLAQPHLSLVLPSGDGLDGFAAGTTVAQPPLSLVLPSSDGLGGFDEGTTVAQSPLSLVLPSGDGLGGLAAGTTVAQPPLFLVLPADVELAGGANAVVAQPPASIEIKKPLVLMKQIPKRKAGSK